MESKIFGLLTAFVFTLVLFVSLTSAVSLVISEINGDDQIVDDNVGTFDITFDLKNNGGLGDLDWSASVVDDIGNAEIDFASLPDSIGVETLLITFTVNFENSNLAQEISGLINVTGDDTSSYDPVPFTITITDTTAPVITLVGDTVVTIGIGTDYIDEGATALDNVDGILIVTDISNLVDTSVVGVYTIMYSVLDIAGNNATITRTVNVIKFFCNDGLGAVNDSKLILRVDINNKGEGEDNEWLPLDTIEIEVELENNNHKIDFDGDGDKDDGDGDLDDVIFELGFFDDEGNNLIDDMMWISDDDEEVEVGDVDEDETETHVFKFRVDPSEFDKGDYILKVKAYPDSEEEDFCIDSSRDLDDSDFGPSEFTAEIRIDKESDDEKMVVVDEEKFPTPTVAFCSEEVELSVDVYSIGDKDFFDQIKVTLYNKALGIDLENVLDGDLDEGERARTSFTFTVPVDADEKQYSLSLITYYDYDENDEEYDEISEEIFTASLKVEGNCIIQSHITLDTVKSSGKAGEPLVVKTTVTNTGTKTVNYVFSAEGYSSWANSAELSVTSLSLTPGESEVISITFNVNKNAFGNQNFIIEVLSGDKVVMQNPESVFIEKRDGFFSKITGSVVGIKDGNWYLWGIGAVNVLLVLAIVFVVVRMLRRS